MYSYKDKRSLVIEILTKCQNAIASVNERDPYIAILNGVLQQLHKNVSYRITVDYIYTKIDKLNENIQNISSDDAATKASAIQSIEDILQIARKRLTEEQKDNSNGTGTRKAFAKAAITLRQRKDEIDAKLKKMEEKGDVESEEYMKLKGDSADLERQISEAEENELKRLLNDGANEELGNKVTKLTTDLDSTLDHLLEERRRISRYYWAFCMGAISLVFILILWEFFGAAPMVKKILENNTYQWYDYTPFYLPIPLFGCLLALCIYQINISQKRLLSLALSIHKVKYADNLLSALSGISVNAKTNEERVGKIVDHIINSYISNDPLVEPSSEKSQVLHLPVEKIIDVLPKLFGKG